MYTKERRRIPEFCDIRRQLDRQYSQISYPPKFALSRTALKLSVNYHQCRTCIYYV